MTVNSGTFLSRVICNTEKVEYNNLLYYNFQGLNFKTRSFFLIKDYLRAKIQSSACEGNNTTNV